MAASFGTDAVALGIGFTVYLLTMAAFIPLAGWLADRLGAREVLVAAVVAFAAASRRSAAPSTSLDGFVAARALQGAAAALMVPVGRNLVLQNTPKSGVMQAIATITWPALTAPVVGPFVGGWITTHFGWQWNFYVNVPLCLAAAVLFLLLVPRQPRPAPRRFDWPGFLLVSGCMVLVDRRARGLRRRRPRRRRRAARVGHRARLARGRPPAPRPRRRSSSSRSSPSAPSPSRPSPPAPSGASPSTPRRSCCRCCCRSASGSRRSRPARSSSSTSSATSR